MLLPFWPLPSLLIPVAFTKLIAKSLLPFAPPKRFAPMSAQTTDITTYVTKWELKWKCTYGICEWLNTPCKFPETKPHCVEKCYTKCPTPPVVVDPYPIFRQDSFSSEEDDSRVIFSTSILKEGSYFSEEVY